MILKTTRNHKSSFIFLWKIWTSPLTKRLTKALRSSRRPTLKINQFSKMIKLMTKLILRWVINIFSSLTFIKNWRKMKDKRSKPAKITYTLIKSSSQLWDHQPLFCNTPQILKVKKHLNWQGNSEQTLSWSTCWDFSVKDFNSDLKSYTENDSTAGSLKF